MVVDAQRLLEEAFHEAVDLDAQAQQVYVARFAASHPGLEQELRGLLAADASGASAVAQPIVSSVLALANQVTDPWVGRQLGPWSVTKRLGAGGMGAVFLAERNDAHVSQRVAIKIMAQQLAGPAAMARFRVERQILATLNHPNIARLIDGGATEEGLPYLVMELVDGHPVDHYCNEHKLSIARRLEVFQELCTAVDHAHRNLVVHRDLKPSNVLVDTHAGLKLLDFGIAKLLDDADVCSTAVKTRAGEGPMTPAYASPEQLRGETVTVATDVYSLGVLLHQLLTGCSPYGPDLTSQGDLREAILNRMPVRPSATVDTAPEMADRIATARATSTEHLRRRLRGDLDNIVLKCLAKAPARRYAGALALSDDIGRYLRSEPVLARGDSWAYRCRKFIVRRTRLVIATTAVALTGIVFLAYHTSRLANERDKANWAAAEANRASAQATLLSDTLSSIFSNASPHVSQGRDVTAIQLLDVARQDIAKLRDEPEVQAKLYQVMGTSYTGLGDYDRARDLLAESVRILETLDNTDPLVLAEALKELAEAQRLAGDTQSAIDNRRRVLAITRKAMGEDHPLFASALQRLAVTLGNERSEEALPMLQQALAIQRRAKQGNDDVTLDILGNIAVKLDTLGRYDESVAISQELIPLSENIIGTHSPNTLIRMNNLALILRRQYRLAAAARQSAATIERATKTWAASHPFLITSKLQYALVLQYLGQLSEAQTLLSDVSEVVRKSNEQSILFARYLYALGRLHMDTANYTLAAKNYRRALRIATSLHGKNEWWVIVLTIHLGSALVELGEYPEAEELLLRALGRGSRVGKDHLHRAQRELARVYSRQGRDDEASLQFRDTLASTESCVGPNSPALVRVLVHSAGHHRRAGRLRKAHALASRAHHLAQAGLPRDNWIGAEATAEYARVLVALHQTSAARPLLRQAHHALLATFGPEDPRVKRLALELD